MRYAEPVMFGVELMSYCPDCDHSLIHERGYSGDALQPEEPEQLYCPSCGWEADEPIDAYLSFYDDDGSL